jgi:hypothetical protein
MVVVHSIAVGACPPAVAEPGVRTIYLSAARCAAPAFGVCEKDVVKTEGANNGNHSASVALARRVVIYLAVTVSNQSSRAVARASGLSPRGVRRALRVVEELRDCAVFDQLINRLEAEFVS